MLKYAYNQISLRSCYHSAQQYQMSSLSRVKMIFIKYSCGAGYKRDRVRECFQIWRLTKASGRDHGERDAQLVKVVRESFLKVFNL